MEYEAKNDKEELADQYYDRLALEYEEKVFDEKIAPNLYPGVDLSSYNIIGVLHRGDGNPIILQQAKQCDVFPFAIKQKGENGRYFRNFHDMADFLFKRYSKPLSVQELQDLSREYREYIALARAEHEAKMEAKN